MRVHHKRTPLQGLEILENLYQNYPSHQGITNSLINAYIHFGIHDKAMDIIAKIPDNKTDVQILRFKAWVEFRKNNKYKEKSIYNEILDKNTSLAVFTKYNNNIIDIKLIKHNEHDILLFCKIFNEIIRLPFFLKYYRNLGIKKFFIIDNNSNDGSLEFLLKQPDCNIFWTNDSHLQAGGGTAWINQLIDRFSTNGQWCLYVDVDEFLIYPNCESYKIQTLVKYLDRNNDEGMSSYMLDIFPKNMTKAKTIKPKDNIIKKSPYFYNNYNFLEKLESPYINPKGGIFAYLGIIVPLVKVSLFKFSDNFKFLGASHQTTPIQISKITSIYLHAKLVGDFYQVTQRELKRKEYARGANNYRHYAKIYKQFKSDFTNLPKTTKYQNSQQLVDLGLIQCPDDWKEFIKGKIYNEK